MIMKRLIVELDENFKEKKDLTKKVLKKLEKLFDLTTKYVEVYLVGNGFMEKNVLSFPAPKDFPRPDLKSHESLGEIYLNPLYIEKNNEDFVFMLVHGFLHLLGFDHEKGPRAHKDRPSTTNGLYLAIAGPASQLHWLHLAKVDGKIHKSDQQPVLQPMCSRPPPEY